MLVNYECQQESKWVIQKGRVLGYKYDWSFVDYLYTPREALEHDVWNCFIDKFKALLENTYKLIIK